MKFLVLLLLSFTAAPSFSANSLIERGRADGQAPFEIMENAYANGSPLFIEEVLPECITEGFVRRPYYKQTKRIGKETKSVSISEYYSCLYTFKTVLSAATSAVGSLFPAKPEVSTAKKYLLQSLLSTVGEDANTDDLGMVNSEYRHEEPAGPLDHLLRKRSITVSSLEMDTVGKYQFDIISCTNYGSSANANDCKKTVGSISIRKIGLEAVIQVIESVFLKKSDSENYIYDKEGSSLYYIYLIN